MDLSTAITVERMIMNTQSKHWYYSESTLFVVGILISNSADKLIMQVKAAAQENRKNNCVS